MMVVPVAVFLMATLSPSIQIQAQDLAGLGTFSGYNLESINIDQLSDKEITEGFSKAYSRGYSDNEIYSLLESGGMPQTEIGKLRVRYDQINNNNTQVIETVDEQRKILSEIAGPEKSANFDPVNMNPETQWQLPGEESNEIYGQSIFRQGNIAFYEKAVNMEAPSNYVLGVGDRISVNIWGFSDFNGTYEIESWGGIQDRSIDRIYLRGLTFEKAKEVLKARFGQVFNSSNSQFAFTVSYFREVTISIIGEVEVPGSYRIPAVNSLFNAMTICKGTNNTGSIRNIQVFRGGKEVHRLDVYHYLNFPDRQADFFLENGDVILVPPSAKVVEIAGEIRRPGKYEMKENEDLGLLIKYAGGTTSKAYLKNIHVQRVVNNESQVVIDLDLDSLGRGNDKFVMQDGDIVSIDEISSRVRNFVELRGSVGLPGRYEFVQGERLLSLIKRANGLQLNTFMETAYLTRLDTVTFTKSIIKLPLMEIVTNPLSEFNVKLERFDLVRIFSKEDFIDEFSIEVTGAVRAPGIFPLEQGMTLSDVLTLARGLKENAYLDQAYIIRRDSSITSYISFSPRKVLEHDEKTGKITLMGRDIVRYFTLEEFKDDFDVTVFGSVRNPIRLIYSQSLTLYDAITLSGGLQFNANNVIEISRFAVSGNDANVISNSIFLSIDIDSEGNLIRNEKSEVPLLPMDNIYVRNRYEVNERRSVTLIGQVKYPGVYPLRAKDEKISDVIQRAGGLTLTAQANAAVFYREEAGLGEVILDLEEALNNVNSSYNYTLTDGDIITIPTTLNFVSIKGLVDYPIAGNDAINAPWVAGKSAKSYINGHANGFAKEAKRSRTYVLQPNRDVDRTKRFFFINFYPKPEAGSVVYVLPKESKNVDEKGQKIPIDWNETIENVTVKATGLLTLWLLVERIRN